MTYPSVISDTVRRDLAAYLTRCEPEVSERGLLKRPVGNIGYHTRLTEKDSAHPTRENFDYALALLAVDGPGYGERAIAILGELLSLQDTDSESKTYGIWSWFVDEPLDRMNPPDWNWAAFCGMRIVQALLKFGDVLPADLVEKLRVALGHATRSIIRRNMGPHYTNIAFMSAHVALAAGEILDEPEFLDFGRSSLGKILESVDYHGNFNEYNSPAYTTLLLQICDALLQSTSDPVALERAEKLRRFVWQNIADSFHPATSQWAGPQSRSYGIRLRPGDTGEITSRLGFSFPCYSNEGGPSDPNVMEKLPCPADIAPRFKALPKESFELKRRFVRRENEVNSQVGTTWFSSEACLGSISQGFLWVQARPVLAYWTVPGSIPAQFRLRFLHDGQDFVSAWTTSQQKGSRVLTCVSFLNNGGDTHPVFSMPENGQIAATDFRLRYELLGQGAEARDCGDGRFELRAGSVHALIQPLAAVFGSETVKWALGRTEGGVVLDAVCYSGPKKTFSFLSLGRACLAAGLDLLEAAAPNPAPREHKESAMDGKTCLAWMDNETALAVEFSPVPHPQPF